MACLKLINQRRSSQQPHMQISASFSGPNIVFIKKKKNKNKAKAKLSRPSWRRVSAIAIAPLSEKSKRETLDARRQRLIFPKSRRQTPLMKFYYTFGAIIYKFV